MKGIRTIILVGVLLFSSLITFPIVLSSTSSASGIRTLSATTNCLPSTVSQPINITNSQCFQAAGVTVTRNGSITVVNSILTGNGQNDKILLIGSAKLTLVNSSIDNMEITISGQSVLRANDSSSLNLGGLSALDESMVQLNSSNLFDSVGTVVVNSTSNLAIYDSHVSTSVTALTLSGKQVSIYNCTISNLVNATSELNSDVSLSGHNITISSSDIISSSATNYATTNAGDSLLSINGTNSVSVSSSNLTSGQTAPSQSYKSSKIAINSGTGNLSASNTMLESVSTAPIISLAANSSSTSSVLLNNSFINMQNSAGILRMVSSQSIMLDNSNVSCPYSTIKVLSNTLDASNSEILVSNVTRDLTFGNGLQTGSFYNTTLSNCSAYTTTCLTVTGAGGSYSISNPILVHVASPNSTSGEQSDATVTVLRESGVRAYSATTNASGWAEIRVLYAYANNYSLVANSFYIVQAFNQGMTSPQILDDPRTPLIADISLGQQTPNFSNSTITEFSETNLSVILGMEVYTYQITPQSPYEIGAYLSAQYYPHIAILSSAVPINFNNNASGEAINFSTVGQNTSTFSFIVVYPKNFTTPLQVMVDGSQDSAVNLESNSTDYFSIFSISSGAHQVALHYSRPSAFYSNTSPNYPKIYPTVYTIIIVVVIAVVGLAFIVAYIKKHDDDYNDKSHT